MKNLLLLIIVAGIISSYGPPNCNLYEGDCAKACHEAELAIRHGQGSKESQIHFDKSIALCPSFDYSYYEKAVPYAKRGYMHDWIIMIDEAISINRKEYLGTRAWYHFFFMHNYQKAIDDIEELDSMTSGDIGMTGDGEYHLNIMKALCYKGLGENEKAIKIIEHQLIDSTHDQGLYDYYYLGVLNYEKGQLQKALKALERQNDYNDIADAHYYQAMIHKKLGNLSMYSRELDTSLKYYDDERRLKNSYTDHMDKVYRQQIINAIEK